jgi:hypothetical protein
MHDALERILTEWRGAVPGVPGASTDETGAPVPAAAALEGAQLEGGGGPGLSVALAAQLEATLGRLSKGIDGVIEDRRRYLADPYSIAWSIPVTQVLQLSGAGAGICDLGGPSQGYLWRVRRVSISDAQSFTTSMGAAVGQFYEGIPTDAPGAATMRPQMVIWPFASLPNAATFGSDEVPLKFGEHLVAVVTGGTPNQVLQVSARYQIVSLASQRPAVETI